MKLSKWISSAALILCAQFAAVQGQGSCEPCGPCNLCDIDFCDMEFCASADFLWWQVCRSDLNFNDDGDTSYINPGYDAGFRVAAVSRYRCWDFGVRYTYFHPSDSKDDNKYDLESDVVDIEMGYTCSLDCLNGSLRPFAGAKLAWIDEKRDLDGDEDKIDFNGYGLYLGLEARYQLCDYCLCDRNVPIALVTRASTGILHSEFKFDGSRGDECLYVPVQELSAALDFTFCDMCGWDTFMQVGYAVTSFSNWREFDSRDDIASLGYGGLFVRLGACF